jgi:hypothetical protein
LAETLHWQLSTHAASSRPLAARRTCFEHVLDVLQLVLVAHIDVLQLKQRLLQVDALLNVLVDLLQGAATLHNNKQGARYAVVQHRPGQT